MTRRSVVVIGSGVAGLAAAVSAATDGASVTILEKAATIGGTTAISGGEIWIPGNRWATAAGIADSAAAGLQYLHSVGLGDADFALAETYVAQCNRIVETTEQRTPLRWQMAPKPDYHVELPGGRASGRTLGIDSVQVSDDTLRRLRPDPYHAPSVSRRDLATYDQAELTQRERQGFVARGRGVVAGLLATAESLGVRVVTRARAASLLAADDTIVGVTADGATFYGQVVLASGGFERDPALVRTFLRGPMLAPASPPTNVGDGLRMGMTVGAALGNMAEAWWVPALSLPGETFDGAAFHRMFFVESAQPGSIVVDSRGQRFVNEAANYNEFGRAMQNFDASTYSFPAAASWFVCDAERRASFPIGPLTGADADPPWLLTAATIEDLAVQMGVAPARLCAALERYNAMSDRGIDQDFGRGTAVYDAFASSGLIGPPTRAGRLPSASLGNDPQRQQGQGQLSTRQQLRPLTEPPFHAARLTPGCLGTKGGLKIDAHARVQRADGRGPISGLHAAGNAAANPFGCAYPGGGSTIGPGLVFGWLAGEHASAQAG